MTRPNDKLRAKSLKALRKAAIAEMRGALARQGSTLLSTPDRVKYADDQPRDDHGRWSGGGGSDGPSAGWSDANVPPEFSPAADKPGKDPLRATENAQRSLGRVRVPDGVSVWKEDPRTVTIGTGPSGHVLGSVGLTFHPESGDATFTAHPNFDAGGPKNFDTAQAATDWLLQRSADPRASGGSAQTGYTPSPSSIGTLDDHLARTRGFD